MQYLYLVTLNFFSCIIIYQLVIKPLPQGEKASVEEFIWSQYSFGSEDKASACSAGDPGSIPGLGRFTGEGNGTHSSTLAWRIPWTEEPGGLQSTGSQGVGHD